MPELPEVETVVADLRRAGLEGARICGVQVSWRNIVAGGSVAQFRERVVGRTIRSVRRRAKYIVLALDDDAVLLVHLRMTGRLVFHAAGEPRDAHEHLSLALQDGRQLRFHDTRKFGRWQWTDAPESLLGRLGPEPMEDAFTPAVFRARLATRRGRLKPLLLDQRFLAGIGNIYADEALFEARLHPCRGAETLSATEKGRLYRAIRAVLRRGVKNLGTSLGAARTNFYSVSGRRGSNQDALRVFRRTGEPCPRCATPIARIVVGQRGTHLCPRCQPPTG